VVGVSGDGTDVVVPIGESVTMRQTVAHAAETVAGAVDERGPSRLHLVYAVPWRPIAGESERMAEALELLERAAVWAREDLGHEDPETSSPDGETPPVEVLTATVGVDEYLFSPADYAEVILSYAEANGADRILLDPEYAPAGRAPMLRRLQSELGGASVPAEEAPVERPRRGVVLAGRETASQYLTVFALSFAFYQLLGGFGHLTFNVITGAISATIAALVLGRVSFTRPPNLRRITVQTARLFVYAPYLLWEIAKANLDIAYVVLHPSLPIDPRMVEFDGAVWGDMPVTTLANSITLTPGTLTVDVDREKFHIHALTKSSRDDLLAGGLERAVRFVFYGRAAMNIPTPAERRGGDDD
jgi:multicomponent Na+:H+ antiporter subunit E